MFRSNAVNNQSCFGDDGVSVDATGTVDVDSLVNAGVQYGSSTAGVKAIAGEVAAGAAVGTALGTAVPLIGNVAGAMIGTIAGLVAGLAPYITGALQGQCTITIAGLDTDCMDYPKNVQGAAQWLHDNPIAALSLDPDTFASQAKVVIPNFSDWVDSLPWQDYKDKIHGSPAWPTLQKLPGTQNLLRAVQLPAASALAAATPELISLYKVTFPQTFPALLPDDIAKIALKVQPLLDAKIANVAHWVSAQALYPTADATHKAFPAIAPADINRAMSMAPETDTQKQNKLFQEVAKGPKITQKIGISNLNALSGALDQGIAADNAAKLAAATAALRAKEKWWQKLLEKLHLRKPPVATL